MTLQVKRYQLGIFDSFFMDTCAGGSLPFLMPDPITDGWPLLNEAGQPILTEAGLPLLMSATWLCLFGKQLPAVSIAGIEFRVSFDVMVMP